MQNNKGWASPNTPNVQYVYVTTLHGRGMAHTLTAPSRT